MAVARRDAIHRVSESCNIKAKNEKLKETSIHRVLKRCRIDLTNKKRENKMKKYRPTDRTMGVLFIIYYLVGLVGLSLPAGRELFITLMPLSLLMSFVLMLWYHRSWKPVHVVVIGAIALAGYLVEVVGVLTGEVFGEYTYGRALGLKLFATPLMIGVNWIMLVYGFHALLEGFRWPWSLKVLGGAVLMVVYDVIMEPVAISLDMWSWGGGAIPLQNYVAWFVISVVFLTVMQLAKVKTGNQVAVWLIAVQTGFFLALNLLV